MGSLAEPGALPACHLAKLVAWYFFTWSGNNSCPSVAARRILQASGIRSQGGALKSAVTVNGTDLFSMWLWRVSSNSMGRPCGPPKAVYTIMLFSE